MNQESVLIRFIPKDKEELLLINDEINNFLELLRNKFPIDRFEKYEH